jgi:putative ABC transport system permease protein
MENLFRDLRIGLRVFRRARLLAIAALVTLAVGIGLASALFGVVDAFLIRPLPYRDPDRLAMIWERNPRLGLDRSPVAAANFVEWKAQSRSFSAMTAYEIQELTLTDDERHEQVVAARASAEFFSLIGVATALGRPFLAEEDGPAAAPVAVVSAKLWSSLYGESRSLPQTITLDGERLSVIGVMPPGFRFPRGVDLWLPLGPELSKQLERRGSRSLSVLARLSPGVSLAAARQEMAALSSRLARELPDINDGHTATVLSLREQISGRLRPALLVLSGGVVFALLAVITNVAGLLLAQAEERRQEIVVRAALGAPRVRLVAQILTESLLLAAAGALGGLLLARATLAGLVALLPPEVLQDVEISFDPRILAFGTALALIAGVLAGIFPALQSCRPDLSTVLNEGSSAVSRGVAGRRFRRLLVSSQVVLALVLAIGAGLTTRSFRRLAEVDPGFDPQGVLAVRFVLPESVRGMRARAAFVDQLLAALRARPAMAACAVTSRLPLGGPAPLFEFAVANRAASPAEVPSTTYEQVSPEYFRLLGIPLRRGRSFTDRDVAGGPPVAVINETLARRYFPGQDPVGQSLSLSLGQQVDSEIVGVVGDVRQADLSEEPQPAVYAPFAQSPISFFTLLVRSEASDPLRLVPEVRAGIDAVSPGRPISRITTLERLLADSLSRQRLGSVLFGSFATVALLLAVVGVYGLAHDSVLRRRREIGLRMALGAHPGSVVKLVVLEIMATVLPGLAVGLGAAALLSRLLASLLYGIQATDAVSFLVVPLLLAATTGVAAYLPARRAAHVDPSLALRRTVPQ